MIRDPGVLSAAEKSTRLGIDTQRVETSAEAAKLAESLARVMAKRTRLLEYTRRLFRNGAAASWRASE